MKTFRIIVGILAMLALAFFLATVLLPPVMNDQDSLIELLYPIIGVPILTLNFWAWSYPEIIESYFLGNQGKLG